mmetsp:Transcript_10371/g.21613  ORF Transcript_10371/g.21613 Transcript_10371/m.21613 type:complete len:80 (+) Transcript_10371:1568-1807(+)
MVQQCQLQRQKANTSNKNTVGRQQQLLSSQIKIHIVRKLGYYSRNGKMFDECESTLLSEIKKSITYYGVLRTIFYRTIP